ncbi:aminotransferase class I/II-fold pyridoxal phosphate-dependent enzyme [bacterium]|nr:aminotransferase class I/II-fold pyridoxal phosphate-dependent enzyme [bacterium]
MKIAQFKVEEWMNRYESSAKYDLTTTCIKPLSIQDLCGFAPPEILTKPLTYGDITGSDKLKGEIAKLYSNTELKNITITHGAIGANQLVFLSLLEKGDEVVSIVPTYQQHYSIPEAFGANVKLLFLKESNNWLPNIEELENAVTRKTKLLCLNNPNNPTGAVIPDEMLKQIAEIAQENNIWVLSDEVYRGLNLEGNPYSVSFADIYEKGISVGSMSKTYSLPGLRVGWIAAREDLIDDINKQRQYNTISVSILDDYFASVALKNKDWIAERNFKILKEGYSILKDWTEFEPYIKCILPQGGTTALLRLRKNIPSKKFCYDLQKATGVALLPGETMEMEGHVRLGFCAENLKEALITISEFLS